MYEIHLVPAFTTDFVLNQRPFRADGAGFHAVCGSQLHIQTHRCISRARVREESALTPSVVQELGAQIEWH